MIEWEKLPFGYMPTNANIRCKYTNGAWGNIEIHHSETLELHMSATCLHYGQECFEGLKAYRGKDGKIRLFRWEENSKRLNESAKRIGMPEIPKEIFKESLIKLISLNQEFVPPYGTGASMYIRPLIIGTEAKLGLSASIENLFVLFCSPVGPYFKTGFKPVKVLVERHTDRAAPLGTGHVKVGGNYAAALNTTLEATKKGYSAALFLDPKEKKYIDECGPANFFGIKNNTYITPKSSSILPSITNMSLIDLASHLGMKVERRQVELTEVGTFEEVGQCGTAAVLTPIYCIADIDNGKEYIFGDSETPGKQSQRLYETLVGIQFGDIPDPFNWITIVE